MVDNIEGVDRLLRFQKALMLADRGETHRAQGVLHALLDADPSPALRVRALVALGDLLTVTGEPAAARETLTEAIARAAAVEDADDLLDAELSRAYELLQQRP